MDFNALAFFEWSEASWLGDTIRKSIWLFPAIEALHLLGLSVLGGTLLVLDLRLLGLGLRSQSIPQLARDVRPWFVGAVVVMVVTGSALFASEAIKCYYNQSFWVKMTTLPIALVFAVAVREPVARSAGMEATVRTKVVALTSLTLWLVVAAAGRWIGFSG